MFIRGQIKSEGVFAPEGIVDPKTFLQELTRDIPVWETEETVMSS
jgi:hypothetical protein